MRGDHHAPGTDAFGVAGGDREHDAVAERHDGLLHRLLGIVAIRDRAAGTQQVGFEQAVHEIQRHRLVRDAVAFRVLSLANGISRALCLAP